MHLQENTNLEPLIVHHAFRCYVDGGNKLKHFVRGNFFSQTFMGTMGGFDSAVETDALTQIGRSEIRQAISNFFFFASSVLN
jgi:hypothetical protein